VWSDDDQALFMIGPPGLPPPRPIPIKDRASFISIEKGQVNVLDGAFVVDQNGIQTQIRVGEVTWPFLEPGTRISHAAVGLVARVGTLLV
jgi:CRISPR-associated protein Cas1